LQSDPLVLYGETFQSRLLLGTARYPSPDLLEAAVQRARPAMLTASLRRQTGHQGSAATTPATASGRCCAAGVPVLPNTAGCHSVQEVVATAQMARELFDTPWIKLELIGDDYTLQPDTLNLVDAASQLIRDGFKVLPYCTEDLVLCQRLVDIGCQAVMPWAAPIGTGRGPINPYALQVLRDRLKVPMLVDAGLGLPVACLPGDGVGLRRRAAQHGRCAGARPGRHGRRFRRCGAGRPHRVPRRCHGRARRRAAQHARAGHALLAPRTMSATFQHRRPRGAQPSSRRTGCASAPSPRHRSAHPCFPRTTRSTAAPSGPAPRWASSKSMPNAWPWPGTHRRNA
jgi:thiazole synthase